MSAWWAGSCRAGPEALDGLGTKFVDTKSHAFAMRLRRNEADPQQPDSTKARVCSINYKRHGVENAMYPDFIIFRRANGSILCDILEPHSQREADSAAKARGLAVFAEKHGHQFGRIELIDDVEGVIKRLRLKDTETNKRVQTVANDEALRLQFLDA